MATGISLDDRLTSPVRGLLFVKLQPLERQPIYASYLCGTSRRWRSRYGAVRPRRERRSDGEGSAVTASALTGRLVRGLLFVVRGHLFVQLQPLRYWRGTSDSGVVDLLKVMCDHGEGGEGRRG